MLVCVNVHYAGTSATAAAVVFEDWRSSGAVAEHVMRFDAIADYVPGEFYRRELPCIIPLIESLNTKPEAVVVDGYVWLRDGKAGLGAYVHEALGGDIPVIGVAKNEFAGAPAVEVLRGESERPLYVTAAGMDVSIASECVRTMHGPYRIPTLLKLVDAVCRNA